VPLGACTNPCATVIPHHQHLCIACLMLTRVSARHECREYPTSNPAIMRLRRICSAQKGGPDSRFGDRRHDDFGSSRHHRRLVLCLTLRCVDAGSSHVRACGFICFIRYQALATMPDERILGGRCTIYRHLMSAPLKCRLRTMARPVRDRPYQARISHRPPRSARG